MKKENTDIARAFYYLLLSKFFIFIDNKERFENLNQMLQIAYDNPFDLSLKQPLKNLLDVSLKDTLIINEYDEIFHSPANKTLRNTASYYDEGFESGKKLLEIRNYIAKTTIRKNEKNFKENEDSIGFLFSFMNDLISQKYDLSLQHEVFKNILNPCIDTFLDNLYNHDQSLIYKDVANLAKAFMSFERLYFSENKAKDSSNIRSKDGISRSEMIRRATNKAKKDNDRIKKKEENNERR